MKLAINQPYFFPYVGYFSLICSTDKFIVFDTPQYIRKGWVNRNRILKPSGKDWQYIGIPVKKHSRDCSILEIEARDDSWKEKLLGQLQHYKKKAKYYSETLSFLEQSLDYDESNLNSINIHLLKSTCEHLGFEFNYEVYSDMDLVHNKPNDAGEWALYISESLQASTYVNLPGGRTIFSKEKFRNIDIDLKFIEADLSDYRNGSGKNLKFFAGLSILDVLMFRGREGTREIIENYKLFE